MEIDEKIFEGRYINAMPALRADRRVPLTVMQITEKRLEVLLQETSNLSKDGF